jgi:hypothetical protein
MKSNLFAKLGAVAYVLWGLLHLNAARLVWQAGQGLETGFIQGRILQLSWDLLFFAIFSIVVALAMNWKNSLAQPGGRQCCGYRLHSVRAFTGTRADEPRSIGTDYLDSRRCFLDAGIPAG